MEFGRSKGKNLKLYKKFEENWRKPLDIDVELHGGGYKFVGPNATDFIRAISLEVEKDYFNLDAWRNTDKWRGVQLGITAECQRAYKDRKGELKVHFDYNEGYDDVEAARSNLPKYGTDLINVFRSTHYKEGTGWVNDSASTDYFARMERALGHRRGHIRGVGRVVSNPTPDVFGTPSPQPHWQDVDQRVASLQQQFQEQQREAQQEEEQRLQNQQLEEERRVHNQQMLEM
ncbi:hypothetical protein L1987_60370 [Smallanthus sonchifolius]|uniref:Uncharacterized protein n=1 Tax=Smallanthus sonchifolius TaxID=185202 RepID=A0ACB9D8Q2_9ASTR|nr:hypothetical protein L1987_60370 [Smallanthus sonchifolius]